MSITKRILQQNESIADYRYVDFKSIMLPASKILIGTANTLDDAQLFTSTIDLTMDLTLGAANLGLDTGTEAQDQWYAVYAVPGTNGSYGLRFSANAPPQAGGPGPVGFTRYRYLGLIKNGTNGYDGTNSSFGRGDIARFVKNGNYIEFRSLNSTNGAVYPSASGTHGLSIFIANTTTNGTIFDGSNASNFGFSGLNVAGGCKLPYQAAKYIMEGQVNGTYTNGYIRRTDSAANDRQYIPMTNLVSLMRSCQFVVSFLPNAFTATWDEFIRMEISGNPNISRILLVSALEDPYIVKK